MNISKGKSTLPSFREFFLEAQYDKYSNNPDWDPENPLTSGAAFKPWQPAGGWSKKKSSSSSAFKVKKKKLEEPKEDGLDVEGDPVGSFQSISEPQPEEDHSSSMLFVSNADLEKIYRADESLFEYLFKSSEAAIEEPEGIVFRYLAPPIKQKIEQKIQSIIFNKNSLSEAKKMKNTCWSGYKPIGTKKKNGKEVPNCVPIKESLDNPYPYHYSQRDGGYIFFPNPQNDKVLYTVYMLRDPDYDQRLEIMFTYTDEDKDIQGTADMTGTGDAFRVMATVKKIVFEGIHDIGIEKLNIIKFTAKSADSGKVALYKRLANQFQQYLGPKWDLDVLRDKEQVIYELSRNYMS